MNLHFRLSLTDGAAITCTSEQPLEQAKFRRATNDIVRSAFVAFAGQTPRAMGGAVPEILSSATIERLDAMESWIQRACDELGELDKDDARCALIDEADKLLGFA